MHHIGKGGLNNVWIPYIMYVLYILNDFAVVRIYLVMVDQQGCFPFGHSIDHTIVNSKVCQVCQYPIGFRLDIACAFLIIMFSF